MNQVKILAEYELLICWNKVLNPGLIYSSVLGTASTVMTIDLAITAVGTQKTSFNEKEQD